MPNPGIPGFIVPFAKISPFTNFSPMEVNPPDRFKRK